MFTPDTYKLVYSLRKSKKTYREYEFISPSYAGEDMPDLIRTEKNNGFNSITGAENLLRIRDSTNWTKCTLTGLRPTGTPNFYYSDLPIAGVKSLIVVHIPPDLEEIALIICRKYYTYVPADRERIINDIIINF